MLADINKSLNQFQQWLCRKNPQTNSQQSPRKSNWAPNLVLRIAPHNASKTIPSGIPHTSLGHKGYRVPLPFPYFFKYKSGRLDLYCHRGWCIHGDIIDRARLTHIDQDVWVHVACTVSPWVGKCTPRRVTEWELGVVVYIGSGHEC